MYDNMLANKGQNSLHIKLTGMLVMYILCSSIPWVGRGGGVLDLVGDSI